MYLHGLFKAFFLISFFVLYADAQDEATRKAFEKKYIEWKVLFEQERYSSMPGLSKQYEIAELGPAVLPLIVEKMETNFNDFHLRFAFFLITGKSFESDEIPKGVNGGSITTAKLYVKWWKEGRKDTEDKFLRHLEEWKRQKKEGRTDEAKTTLMKMRNLGIIAIPYMIDQIKAGENEFVPLVVFLTHGRQKPEDSLPENADPAACVAW